MARRLQWTVFVLVAVAGSGCLGAPNAPTAGQAGDITDPAFDSLATVNMEGHGCAGLFFGRFMPFDLLAPVLPEGFTPRDGADLLRQGTPAESVPVAMGRGAVVIPVIECPRFVVANGTTEPLALAWLVVMVEPPLVANVTQEKGLRILDFYALQTTVSNHSDLLHQFEMSSINATVGEARIDDMQVANIGGSQAEVVDDEGPLVGFEGFHPAPTQRERDVRVWWMTESGLAFLDFSPQYDYEAGNPTRCTARSETVFEDLFGSTDCGADDGGALLVSYADWEFGGPFTFLPGAHAKA